MFNCSDHVVVIIKNSLCTNCLSNWVRSPSMAESLIGTDCVAEICKKKVVSTSFILKVLIEPR